MDSNSCVMAEMETTTPHGSPNHTGRRRTVAAGSDDSITDSTLHEKTLRNTLTETQQTNYRITMEIKLTRIARRKDYTIGRMEIDNEYICDTLEPTWRDLAHGGRKQKGKTAIPEGRYALVVTKSPKFKKWLPLLLGVPGFDGVRIHSGNTPKDTQGCILVGQNRKKGMVLNSRIAMEEIMKILDSRKAGEPVFITIV